MRVRFERPQVYGRPLSRGRYRRRELHWKRAQSTHNEPAAPAQIGRISRELKVGETGEEGGERGLALQAGERGAEAVVDAVPVAEVLVVTAGEVERVRPFEPRGVTVRSREDHEDGVAGRDALTADAHGLGREPPRGQFHGPVVTEEFLDAGLEESAFAGGEGPLQTRAARGG